MSEYPHGGKGRGRRQPPPFDERAAAKEAEYWIDWFEKPARRLLELLAPRIRARSFDSLLGDDSGGRIHTLVLGQAIQDLYGADKRLSLVFVQGGRLLKGDEPFEARYSESDVRRDPLLRAALAAGELEREPQDPEDGYDEPSYRLHRATTHAEEVRRYFERMLPRLGRRTLIVTEEIDSGASIDILVRLLASVGVEAEAAAFGTTWDEDYPVEGMTNPYITGRGTRMYLGNVYAIGPTMRDEHLGIYEQARSGFGYPVARRYYGSPRAESQMRLVAARDAARAMGHRLADWYRSEIGP